jgi:hypothetical protein
MPQESEQEEELSSDVKRFCALLARIMYRCLKERACDSEICWTARSNPWPLSLQRFNDPCIFKGSIEKITNPKLDGPLSYIRQVKRFSRTLSTPRMSFH